MALKKMVYLILRERGQEHNMEGNLAIDSKLAIDNELDTRNELATRNTKNSSSIVAFVSYMLDKEDDKSCLFM